MYTDRTFFSNLKKFPNPYISKYNFRITDGNAKSLGLVAVLLRLDDGALICIMICMRVSHFPGHSPIASVGTPLATMMEGRPSSSHGRGGSCDLGNPSSPRRAELSLRRIPFFGGFHMKCKSGSLAERRVKGCSVGPFPHFSNNK